MFYTQFLTIGILIWRLNKEERRLEYLLGSCKHKQCSIQQRPCEEKYVGRSKSAQMVLDV